MIQYDYRDMMRSRVGSEGVEAGDLTALGERLERARLALDAQRQQGKLGFFDVPRQRPSRKAMADILEKLPAGVTTLVVIGIGGSLLGAQAVHRALADLKKGRGRELEVVFAGDAVDPQAWRDLDAAIDWKRAALNVISKSGDTIEPMAIFTLCRERLVKACGATGAAKRIIATTDPERGTLRELAKREGYVTLPVPGNVGGRFSVLTEVGAFPLLAAGIEIDELWEGAAEATERFWKVAPTENVPMIFAGLQHLFYRQGKPISVLMPYVQRLQLVGQWYRQLWAESLGKKLDRSKKVVNVGPTPIAAQGPADQHSQIQLYNEGPRDKTVTFVGLDHHGADIALPRPFPDLEALAYFGGATLSELAKAELEATAEALTLNHRPNGTFRLPDLSARSVGALLQTLMIATAVVGELFDVNAYDQPGVEAGKRNLYRIFGREGFK